MSLKNDSSISIEQAWEKIIDKYDVINELEKSKYFHISAKQIKEFKEPRLMAKWDSHETLPTVFKDNNINILPTSRGSYVLSDFMLYEDIPELEENVIQMDQIQIPELESIDINNVNSESCAINIITISNLLDIFLETDENLRTFDGRMGTRDFTFKVNSHSGEKRTVIVNNAQCEIDAGFENNSSVIILEAKNVVYKDFHIRQLYYPYRLWQKKVTKPIRLVFSVYSNKIYRLFEYAFEDMEDYSSIKLIRTKNYSLEETNIELEDLIFVRKTTEILTDDNADSEKGSLTPFIQADSFARIISLLENLYDNDMTTQEITELMQFAPRQAGYYFNAGKYLGLFEKVNKSKNERDCISLTKVGKEIFKQNYKKRQLSIVSKILEHQIFADLFDYTVENGDYPAKDHIIRKMKEYNVCGNSLLDRRSSSVLSWLKWIFNLTKL